MQVRLLLHFHIQIQIIMLFPWSHIIIVESSPGDSFMYMMNVLVNISRNVHKGMLNKYFYNIL
jgi:hypothetical protein